jgi:hypothetical protein
MSRLIRWYGAGPLHLLTMVGCFAVAGYAAAKLLPNNLIGIPVWFVGAVIGHDLILMPLYTLADRSVTAVLRHRQPSLPAVPWINYLRVPTALAGLLLLIWFPLIFRLPTGFPASTTLSLNPYLWHWLAVTGALFLLSATALALRLGTARRGARNGRTSGPETADPLSEPTPGPSSDVPPDPPSDVIAGHPADVIPGQPERPGLVLPHGQAGAGNPAGAGKTSPGPDAHVPKDVAPADAPRPDDS